MSKLNEKEKSEKEKSNPMKRQRRLQLKTFLHGVDSGALELRSMRRQPVRQCWTRYEGLDQSDSPFNTATNELRTLFRGDESPPSDIYWKQIVDFIEIVGETLQVVVWAKFVPPEQWHLWIVSRSRTALPVVLLTDSTSRT